MKIDLKDISIVVQGPINKDLTKKCLIQLRKIFPGSEIILSTTKNEDIFGLSYDKIVLNEDQGEDPGFKDLHVNLGRQIFSTLNGIKQSNKKYILKTRGDLFFKDNKFLNYFDKFNSYEEEFKLFKKRIIISSYFTRCSKVSNWLFHPSDWCFFGLREDLLNLFDIELPKEYNNTYLKTHIISNHNVLIKNCYMQYWGEQYIFVKCLLKNKKNICFNDYTDINEKSRFLSEHFILNNFIVLDYGKNFNFRFLKYKINKPYLCFEKILTYYEFLKLYKQNCDKSYRIHFKDKDIEIKKFILKFIKHFNRFLQPILIFLKWIKELICIIYYSVRILINVLLNFWKIFFK